MKIASTCIFALAIISLQSIVRASPLAKRACYHGSKAALTAYWIPSQGTTDVDNDGNKMHLTGRKNTPLRTPSGKVIAVVDKETGEKCKMEGTCIVIVHGKEILINLADGGSHFTVVNIKRNPFGSGSEDNSLAPFVSVAVNDMELGTKMFVKELKGRKLPNGLVHNGCVRVDDEGWSFGDCQLDWFVLEYSNYVYMNAPTHITVTVKPCKLLDYTTNDEYDYVGIETNDDDDDDNDDDDEDDDDEDKPVDKPSKTKTSAAPTKTPKTQPKAKGTCNTSGVYFKSYTSADFGGSETCVSGEGCHALPGAIKSFKSSGEKVTLFSSDSCSGETFYVDSLSEDSNVSGDGNGFKAGSVMIG